MQPTPEQYNQMIQRSCGKSPLGKNMLWAFAVGGGICALGQGVLVFWQMAGLDESAAGTAVSITLIALSALLTGLQFKSEGLVLGTAAKMFTIAGPVLVYGISASIVYGVVLAIFGGA